MANSAYWWKQADDMAMARDRWMQYAMAARKPESKQSALERAERFDGRMEEFARRARKQQVVELNAARIA